MTENNNLVITNAWICQLSNQSVKPIFGDLQIKEGVITDIKERNFAEFMKSSAFHKTKSFNAGGRVVTVPLINFHDHIYSRLAKGLNITGKLNNFQNILENLWWRLDRILDEDMVCASAEMAALESIRNGVTYVFDHHSSPSFINNSLNIISTALLNYKLRSVVCFEVSDRNGAEITRQSLDENKNFAELSISDDCKSMLGLHASFTISDETLYKAAKIVKELDLGIHIHLCEDIIDNTLSKKLLGEYPLQRLADNNLLNAKSILAHGIDISQNEYQLIEKGESGIAHNFDSNMNNSVGLPDLVNLPESILRLPGTDGMHADISKAMKNLFLLMRHQKHSYDEAFHLFKKLYFDQITFVGRYFTDFPHLNVNDRADFIIWDYTPPTPLNQENFWGHLIYGILERPVQSVIQGGQFLLKNFQYINKDEDKIMKNIYRQGERLYSKFG